jgi:hypothetical protein
MAFEQALLLPLIFGFVRGKDHKLPFVIDDLDKDHSGIRCPSCKWRPARTDTWACAPGCGHAWNTFSTGGQCPGCQKLWSATQCIKCGQWSDHDAWYEDSPHR